MDGWSPQVASCTVIWQSGNEWEYIFTGLVIVVVVDWSDSHPGTMHTTKLNVEVFPNFITC